ncbi:MAG: hypothetical protein WKG07_36895 [Hymenobacter sp.]
MRNWLFIGLTSVLLGRHQPVFGQSRPSDSTLVATAERRLQQQYGRAIGAESRLYNGPEYVEYVPPQTRAAFFLTAEAQPATITYGGNVYAGVPLRYDLVRAQLVLSTPLGREMRLLNEQVTRFELGAHAFVRLALDSTQASLAKPDLYEVLVEGPLQLLAAHHKTLQELNGGGPRGKEITAKDAFFVRKNQRYYPVDNGAALRRLFPARKAALRQYGKEHKLSFRAEERADALSELVRYLNGLGE